MKPETIKEHVERWRAIDKELEEKNCNTCFFGGQGRRTSEGCGRATNSPICRSWEKP